MSYDHQNNALQPLCGVSGEQPSQSMGPAEPQPLHFPNVPGNYYIVTRDDGKMASLLTYLEGIEVKKAIVFMPTYMAVTYWTTQMRNLYTEAPIFGLYGKMKRQRDSILEEYINSDTGILLSTEAQYRTHDVPEPDLVIQWDPPAEQSEYTLRVIRVAQLGVQNSTLILLTKAETAFLPHFQKQQNVCLTALKDAAPECRAMELMTQMREAQKLDRNLFDKANKAYIEHIAVYKLHEEIPFVALGIMYGLFKLPNQVKMLKQIRKNFPADDFDCNIIKYLNPGKEGNRQTRLIQFGLHGKWPRSSKKVQTQKPDEVWTKSKIKREAKKLKNLKKHERVKRKLQRNGRCNDYSGMGSADDFVSTSGTQ